uniref:Uncharacterized protein n=1 Tax=Sphaerodactylus townsendi TaxID=933632 RepID=A0ACB8ECA2_9SAUR
MTDTDGATGGPLAGEPDEGAGQVPDKDEIPRNLDLGDEEKDALITNRHDPHLAATRSTDREANMGLPYSWAPSQQPCWAEIHHSCCCRCLQRGESSACTPNNVPPKQPGPPGPPEPQPPQPPRWHLKSHFDGTTEMPLYFLMQVEVHMEKYGSNYEDEVEQVHEVGALLGGVVASWYVGLYKGQAPELSFFPHFMSALRWQFEDLFKEEKAHASLWQIRQGS